MRRSSVKPGLLSQAVWTVILAAILIAMVATPLAILSVARLGSRLGRSYPGEIRGPARTYAPLSGDSGR